MKSPGGRDPHNVRQFITGGWAAAILGSAARHGIFDALEGGSDAEGVADKAGISLRGAEAVLDGLTSLGLICCTGGLYRNSLAGNPAASISAEPPDNDFWHVLVPAIAALSFPVAQLAAERLGVAGAGPITWLDVGGGSGVWSAVWLRLNQQAHAFQLDWPVVNKIAKGYVAESGVADRFHTIDGDFRRTDFGSAKYDVGLYGHVAHQEAPEANIETFRNFRRAIKPGGTLVINDFVVTDDRAGHPFARLSASQMLLVTEGAFSYRQSDYRKWLAEAGFPHADITPTSTPSTLVFAS